MNERQRRFADEYIISGNVYQSAIKAGYSENYAKTHSHKILENVSVKSYISEKMAKIESSKVADQQEVLEFLTAIMRGEETEQVLRGVQGGQQTIDDIEVSAKDRIKAAELIGKRYALFTDKQDILQRTVEIKVGEWDED